MARTPVDIKMGQVGLPTGKAAEGASKRIAAARDSELLGIEAFQAFDHMREALSSQLTGGISPGSMAMAYFDWAFHLASAPGKRMELGIKAARKSQRLLVWLWSSVMDPQAPPAIEPLPGGSPFCR